MHPNAAWCSDITYIWTYEGFVYLTGIMDLYSRKIIAWVLSNTLEAKWVVEAIEAAIWISLWSCVCGVQYTYSDYQEATKEFINSYTEKAYPRDNACIESFHSLLKREWINRFKITDYNHAYRLVFEYIEAFYNTVRIHSHCGYVAPDDYEKQYVNEMLKIEEMEEKFRKAS